MTEPVSLAQRLRAGEALRLLFVKMPCPAEIELAGACGLDAVIVDTEHGPGDPVELEHHLRAADAAGIPALVRVPSARPEVILAALDAGAVGVVVPHVRDVATARETVAAAHYPPRGRRGLALTTRAGGYATASLPEHLERAERDTIVMVQIEDAEAIPRVDDILAVDGVSAAFIGATDLSISMGHPGAADHPEVREAIEAVLRAGQRAGVAVATVASDRADAHAWASRGAHVAVYVSTLVMRDALRALVADSTDGRPAPLLLLPGMLGTASLWDSVAQALADTRPLVFGRIDFDDSIEEMASTALVGAPPRFALAAHSLGAIVALAMVRQAPERISALALLNASARPASPAQLSAWEGLESQARDGSFSDLAGDFARGNLPAPDSDLVARVKDMALGVGPRSLLRQLAAQRTRPDSRPHLANIACPVTVISGELDQVCPPALQEELVAGIAGARHEVLKGVGHMSPLEAPGEVARVLSALPG